MASKLLVAWICYCRGLIVVGQAACGHCSLGSIDFRLSSIGVVLENRPGSEEYQMQSESAISNPLKPSDFLVLEEAAVSSPLAVQQALSSVVAKLVSNSLQICYKSV